VDVRAAVSWYLKAAELGHAKAMYSLGVLCERGVGMPVDARAAASWYRKAAEFGHAEAMCFVGDGHGGGVDVSADGNA
jgi:TPR repeat protein